MGELTKEVNPFKKGDLVYYIGNRPELTRNVVIYKVHSVNRQWVRVITNTGDRIGLLYKRFIEARVSDKRTTKEILQSIKDHGRK